MYWLLYILDMRFVLFLCTTTAVWQFAINEYVMLCYVIQCCEMSLSIPSHLCQSTYINSECRESGKCPRKGISRGDMSVPRCIAVVNKPRWRSTSCIKPCSQQTNWTERNSGARRVLDPCSRKRANWRSRTLRTADLQPINFVTPTRVTNSASCNWVNLVRSVQLSSVRLLLTVPLESMCSDMEFSSVLV